MAFTKVRRRWSSFISCIIARHNWRDIARNLHHSVSLFSFFFFAKITYGRHTANAQYSLFIRSLNVRFFRKWLILPGQSFSDIHTSAHIPTHTHVYMSEYTFRQTWAEDVAEKSFVTRCTLYYTYAKKGSRVWHCWRCRCLLNDSHGHCPETLTYYVWLFIATCMLSGSSSSS